MWIEIDIAGYSGCNNLSQPARAVWIEICGCFLDPERWESQPARAVWIEIKQIPPFYKEYIVTACEGCVD